MSPEEILSQIPHAGTPKREKTSGRHEGQAGKRERYVRTSSCCECHSCISCDINDCCFKPG